MNYDVVIIGGGAIGLSAAYYAGMAGAKVLLLEQFETGNQKSSSSGASRMFRVVYSEKYLAELALESQKIWRDLEATFGTPLLDQTGILWFGEETASTNEGQIASAIEVLDELGLTYEEYTAAQIEKKYPFRNLPSNYIGIFQADAGVIRVEQYMRCLRQAVDAQKNVQILEAHRVTSLALQANGVVVSGIDQKSITAFECNGEKLILCAGPATNPILSSVGMQLNLNVWELASAYYKIKEEAQKPYPMWFIFQHREEEDPGLYYGFPEASWEKPGYARVCPDFTARVLHDAYRRQEFPDLGDLMLTSKFVRQRMSGLDDQAQFVSTCLISMTTDENPILAKFPGWIRNAEKACMYVGGWGFKYAPLFGKICADFALAGSTTYSVEEFGFNRPNLLSRETERLRLLKQGLPKTERPQEILIAGAGASGLASALLLKNAGHKVKIIEASNRVGGRIKTERSKFAERQYAELGAMRIPTSHHLTLSLAEKYGLDLKDFVLSDVEANELIYVNGMRARRSAYEKDPGILGYKLSESERGMNADQLLELAMKPILDFVNEDPQNNWPKLVAEFDEFSVSRFLRERSFLSEAAIEMIGILLNAESLLSTSFLEMIRDQTEINRRISFKTIAEGMDLLPRALADELGEDSIVFGTSLEKVIQTQDNRVVFKTNNGDFIGDRAILTIPFSCLAFVEFNPHLTREKRKCIRSLNYDVSTKVLLQFKKRFWEEEGIRGGYTISDTPLRFTYYPDSSVSGTHAVVLASYTWSDDSLKWSGMSEARKIDTALNLLGEVHGKDIRSDFVAGSTADWLMEEHAKGAFALFDPGQEREIATIIPKVEGLIHFAGEHTSLRHAWIEGALESALRVAMEINVQPRSVLPMSATGRLEPVIETQPTDIYPYVSLRKPPARKTFSPH